MSWNFAEELNRWGPEQSERVTLREAQAYCASVTRRHYENFSVISCLLPRRLVPHFQAVYAYCRWSDDLADETGERGAGLLHWWEGQLNTVTAGVATHPVMVALQPTIAQYQIPLEPFKKLLIAFQQDQHTQRYQTFQELLQYCEHSANPVGHLVLYLLECFTPERAKWSDDVCTGLQLANFWQDVSRDVDIGRIYLPREDLARFGVSEADLLAKRFSQQFQELLHFQVMRTQAFFDRGKTLLDGLPRRTRINLRLFILGGEAILQAIRRQHYDVFRRRPQLSKWTKLLLFLRALG